MVAPPSVVPGDCMIGAMRSLLKMVVESWNLRIAVHKLESPDTKVWLVLSPESTRK
jgi:hypothetical protein